MKFLVKVEKWTEIEVEADSAEEAEDQVNTMEGEGSLELDMSIVACPIVEGESV